MNGLIIINKPKGYTSHDVVNVLRKKLNTKKVGHTGTLDPNATGVLPILVGTATKISKYLVEHEKTYIATIKLGKKTDTGDAEGEIIEEDSNLRDIDKNEVEEAIKSFLGKQSQIPPMYSAIKVDGKKLYEYAREGEEINIPTRKIFIKSIKLLNVNKENNSFEYEVEVSKGTYIRTLSEDIAKKLGTIGYMSSLRRTRVDKFDLKKAVTLESLEENKGKEFFENVHFLKAEDVFSSLEKIVLNKRKEELFLNGVKLTFDFPDGIYNIYTFENKYLGIGIVENKLLKRDVIITEE